jgi:hypothetical protein
LGEIGIFCDDRDALKERLFVSSGLQALSPRQAAELGYYTESDIIVPTLPAGMPQPANDIELDSIIAGPGTEHFLQLWHLPKSIGEPILKRCADLAATKAPVTESPLVDIAPGIRGQYLPSRLDPGEQLCVSVDPGKPNPSTGEPSIVGLHIDNWKDPNTLYLVGNAGPGDRWHYIVPEFTRKALGGPHPSHQLQYLQNHPDPDAIKVYWLKIQAPGSDYTEAMVSPVASVLHDGSTLGCPKPSTAFFCRMVHAELGTYLLL